MVGLCHFSASHYFCNRRAHLSNRLDAVLSDYIIRPGDELQINIWGQITANLRVIVDRSGQIYVPQVGQISVAGVHYGDVEQRLKREILKVFKNFNLTANIGRLRSIQIIVVGKAAIPVHTPLMP